MTKINAVIQVIPQVGPHRIASIQEHVDADNGMGNACRDRTDRLRAFRSSAGNGSWCRVAFMPRTMTVTLLDEGDKYVSIDVKHIPQGGTCRMDKDATIGRVGPGTIAGATRVRYAAAQVRSGGCPFMTTSDLSDADYTAAPAAFVHMKDDAWKKVDEIKKDPREKWAEVTGTKNRSRIRPGPRLTLSIAPPGDRQNIRSYRMTLEAKVNRSDIRPELFEEQNTLVVSISATKVVVA